MPLDDRPTASPTLVGPWRWFFVLYFIALTTGTHWQRIEPLGPEHAPPDKLMHFLAFGILAILLERSRFLPRAWMGFVLIALWIPFDEWTQDLVSQWRNWSLSDVLAGLEGLIAATLVTAALVPQSNASEHGPWRAAITAMDHFIDRGIGGRTAIAIGLITTVVVFPLLYFLVWYTLHESWSMTCALITIPIASSAAFPVGIRAWKRAGGPPWPAISTLGWCLVAPALALGWGGGNLLASAGFTGLVIPSSLLFGIGAYSFFLRHAWIRQERLTHG
jgi:hypothetical protein